jgi:hypothetical protein
MHPSSGQEQRPLGAFFEGDLVFPSEALDDGGRGADLRSGLWHQTRELPGYRSINSTCSAPLRTSTASSGRSGIRSSAT